MAMLRQGEISSRHVAAASALRPDIRVWRFAHDTLSRRLPGSIEGCVREEKKEPRVFQAKAARFIPAIVSSHQSPNKAPEPTTMAVTIRAPSSTARASHGRGSSLTFGI